MQWTTLLAGDESLVREDDRELVQHLLAAGFEPHDRAWVAWMDAGDRAAVAPPPMHYRLTNRAETGDRPHPMAERNGPAVEGVPRRCSLYDPALDLAMVAPDGSFAGYALFWADDVTRVGLLEPMRVEDAHARRGLARAMLTEGLDRLPQRGMTRVQGRLRDRSGALPVSERRLPAAGGPAEFRSGDGRKLTVAEDALPALRRSE